jgi:hypothetical protein
LKAAVELPTTMALVVSSQQNKSKNERGISPGAGQGEVKIEVQEVGVVVQEVEELCRRIAEVPNIFAVDADPEEVHELVTSACRTFSAIFAGQESTGQGDGPAGGGQNQEVRVRNSMRMLYYFEQALSAGAIAHRLAAAGIDAGEDETEVLPDELAAGLAPFCKMELDSNVNRFQQLLLFLLNSLQQRGYRRVGSDCYQQVTTDEGHETHAWTLACSIKDFVYSATRKETNFDQWLNLTQNKGNAQSAAEYLAACHDVQFPLLVKDRSTFSFANGMYEARSDRFYPYSAASTAVVESCGSQKTSRIPSNAVACKFFDIVLPFDELSQESQGDWYRIPTPHLQSILDFQEFPEDVCRWMYIMLGRLLYNLNDLDHWQVIPYLKGQASSGKSTILLRVCRNFYDKADVGVLSNNIEKKFGIGAFSEKFLFVAPEIKSDLQMEQAEFQSMVSGEDMSISVKYQTAHTAEWRVPGIMAGNEVPGWVDNSGSITRRIVLFDFTKKVDRADMELGKKLEAEMGAILLKCNRAYLWAVQRYAMDNIWMHLPVYFQRTRDELTENTNVMEHFLKSNFLQFGSDEYMPWNDFISAFQSHVRTHNFRHVPNLTKDFYAPAFLRYSLRKTGKESRHYRGHTYSRVWLEGADVAADSAGGGGFGAGGFDL